MLRPFYLHQPATVADACQLLGELGDEARLYAGGTELLLLMKESLARFRHLVDIKRVPGLAKVEYRNGSLTVGACTTHRILEDAEVVRKYFPVLAKVERRVGNIRVRNVGTIGGNLCFAEPHSDPATLLLVYDALIDLTGLHGSRTLRLEDFFLGPLETALEGGEVMTRIQVPHLPDGMKAVYLRFAYYERPTLGVACAVKLDEDGGIGELRLAVGAIGDKLLRLRPIEDFLRGMRVEEASARLPECLETVYDQLNLMSDFYGSAAYKRHLVMTYLRRAFEKAHEEVKGEIYGARV